MDRRTALLDFYEMLPFEQHPLWRAILSGELDNQQVMQAEVQHWIRTRAGQDLRRNALEIAQQVSPEIFEFLLQTYLEECTTDKTGPSHLELIERLVLAGGVTRGELERALPTPANAASMALYRDIGRRGAGCHMLGAGAVEYFYCQLSPKIYEAYTSTYGMSPDQAETYRVHGPLDREHAERAFAVLDEAVNLHGWEAVELAVRDAFVATSLHYDGMLQAATGELSYWTGRIS
jgi:pyrroloquinoline quinone (PQQ) biosynthesis protein C